MKIKKIKKSQYTLLKLNLIKNQVYKKNIKKNNHDDVINVKTEHVSLHLKKALQIIYKYHINRKKILFIGVPQNFQKKISKIIKKTKHAAIPQSIWINGLLSNRFAIFRHLYLKRRKNIEKKSRLRNKTIHLLISVMKQPDLIVIFNKDLEKNALNETYRLKIPIITLDSNLYFDSKPSYKIPGNFQPMYKKNQHAIFLILGAIIKTSPVFTKPKKRTYKNRNFKKQYFWSCKKISNYVSYKKT